MGELHLPMPSYTIDNNSLHNSSLGWDHNFHSLGVLNKDIMSLVMEGNYSTPFLSPLGSEQEDDFSTGYLEDALVEFSERSKRRRLLLFSDEEIMNMRDSNFLPRGLWNTSNWELSEDFSFTSHMTTFNELSGGPISTSVCSVLGEEANMVMTEMKTPEEEKSFSEIIDSSPSSSSCKDSADTKSIISDKQALFSLDLPVMQVRTYYRERKEPEEEAGGDNEGGVPVRSGEAGRKGRRCDVKRHKRANTDAADKACEASGGGLCMSAMRVPPWPRPFWESCCCTHQDSYSRQRHYHHY
ncbi:uncharacterized protein LOC21402212 isoform X1 [Morus notabilis]|uniref:uncharacterized protein LOC21402212 isoform X1 n=1 Tax=Morus notabilis TaxID=981085 RepID=UPI000CED57D0|nr:uncharacterized protein LOC21402212 isoform X1 [Morus notabilis]